MQIRGESTFSWFEPFDRDRTARDLIDFKQLNSAEPTKSGRLGFNWTRNYSQ